MQHVKTFEERQAAAIRLAQQGKPIRWELLPVSTIDLDTSCDAKNIAVGTILDKLSGEHFEWYGYNLSERDNMYVTVDSLIQPDQFITGVDVDFEAMDVKKANLELAKKNEREGRTGTGRELIPTGIVHRHGFCTGTPKRSLHKDMPNLSNYISWRARVTEFLSERRTPFPNFGEFSIEQGEDALRLVGRTADDLILTYTLGTAADEERFLREIGLDPKILKPAGGLRGLLRRHLEWRGGFEAEQNVYVSTATSIIYGQDGANKYGEIIVLAKGAVNGSYEHPFEVEVRTVSTGKGPEFTLESLAEEVDKKISWSKKAIWVSYPGAESKSVPSWESADCIGATANGLWQKHWPLEVNVQMVQKGSVKSADEVAEDFLYNSFSYITNARQPEACYTLYLFSVLSFLSQHQNVTLKNALTAVGKLIKDKTNKNGEIPRPDLSILNQRAIMRNIIYHAQTPEAALANELYNSLSGSVGDMSAAIAKYVPQLRSLK